MGTGGRASETQPTDQSTRLTRAIGDITGWLGSFPAILASIFVVCIWFIGGAFVGLGNNTYQLVINTGTTIITFLAVFLIQNTQNRDAKAIHLKLDELIRGVEGARTGLVNLEEMPEKDLEQLGEDFRRLHDEQHESIESIGEQLEEVGEQLQRTAEHDHREPRPAGQNGRAK